MTPSTVEAGADVTLTGTGFPYDDATVEFAIDDEDAVFAMSWTDDIGSFEDVRELPAELTGGTHELLAIVDDVVFASTTFTVPGGSSATLAVDPARATPGTRIDVTGAGYPAGSMVELTFSPMTDPIGLAFPDADGEFFAQISIPMDASVGDHTLSASVSGDILATAILTVDPSPAQPTLSLSSLTGAPGGELVLRGEGFEPGTVLDVFFQSTPFHLGSITVGASGTFEFAFSIPADAEPGEHTVTVEVGGSVIASVALTVTAPPTPPTPPTPPSPLPSTGFDPGWLGLAGGLMLVAGLSVIFVARRRA